jgi:hypothetical protein
MKESVIRLYDRPAGLGVGLAAPPVAVRLPLRSGVF